MLRELTEPSGERSLCTVRKVDTSKKLERGKRPWEMGQPRTSPPDKAEQPGVLTRNQKDLTEIDREEKSPEMLILGVRRKDGRPMGKRRRQPTESRKRVGKFHEEM